VFLGGVDHLAILLRRRDRHGDGSFDAFDRIKAQYYAGETQTCDLAEAHVPVPENDQ
jgi:hypothetical protein